MLHQAIELGYRGSDVTGSQPMYDTLVNLRSGPRFLDQMLSMQSQAHDGLLFDNLFVQSVNVQIGFLLGIGLIAARRVGDHAPA